MEGSEVSEGINKDAVFRAVNSWSVLFLGYLAMLH